MSLTIVRGWRDVDPSLKGASVALGNFDGVHLGHRRVLAEAARAAGELKAPFTAIRFSPHPVMVMRPRTPPFLLMTPGQQDRALEALGVELLYDLPFDLALAELSDEDFAREILAGGLGVRHVTAGFNVSFGKARRGDAQTLVRYGEAFGFGVSIVQPVAGPDGGQYSSSGAREAIRRGDPIAAAHILGRAFAIEGVVVEGAKLGREIGFPTANVALGDYVRPALGVYATRTRLPDGRVVPGVAAWGPTPPWAWSSHGWRCGCSISTRTFTARPSRPNSSPSYGRKSGSRPSTRWWPRSGSTRPRPAPCSWRRFSPTRRESRPWPPGSPGYSRC